jgi:hypothetical protein
MDKTRATTILMGVYWAKASEYFFIYLNSDVRRNNNFHYKWWL